MAGAGSVDPARGRHIVALVGAPNVGKSTLFNRLTGARRDMGNWPGTTVEVGSAAWRLPSATVTLMDLPGAQSLDPVSPDEALTRTLLRETTPGPDLVVVTVDAAHLSQSLYLLAQLREEPRRLLVALTMNDVARRRGVECDPVALGTALGVPVVAVDARSGGGVDELARAATAALHGPPVTPRDFVLDGVDAAADPFDLADDRFAWTSRAIEIAAPDPDAEARTFSDRVDAIATSGRWGLPMFFAVMWGVFQVTTRVAAPLQEALGGFIDGPVTDAVTAGLSLIGLGGSVVQSVLVEGILPGVGMLLTFIPLMALMFVLLSLLEDSGYMARAAVVTDRVMRSIGLPGRAFLPLIVGFGCNVPAIVGVRVLPDARHRLLTALLVPFTSCSARLTVYAMVGATFFGEHAGTVVFLMYVASVALVVLVGFLLRSTVLRDLGDDPLVMDLPPYHLPIPRMVARVSWRRLEGFLRTASGVIVATVAAIWVLTAMPAPGVPGGFGDVPVADSVYGRTAQAVSVVFEPAGFADWHTTGALITGFVAKEAVVSTWGQTYASETGTAAAGATPADEATGATMAELLRRDFAASSDGHTGPAVAAFLIFTLAYTPCVATVATLRREIGARWTLFAVGLQLTLAWTLAVAVFQLGSLVW